MKRKRFKALIAEIEADMSRYYQGHWTSLPERWEMQHSDLEPKVKETKDTVINCGTTGCVAGLASFRYAPVGTKFYGDVILLPDETELSSYAKYGQEILGLTYSEREYLFHAGRKWGEIVAFSDMKKEERRDTMRAAGFYV